MLDHIDLRVRDLSEARPLYDAIMPLLGFRHPVEDESDGCICYDSCTGLMESHLPFIALIEDKTHHPSATRIAFYAPGRTAVDEIAATAERHGALSFEAAHFCQEYSPRYYACFFEDASGNKLEVCCRHVSDDAEQDEQRSIVRMPKFATKTE
ncbi:MAG: VOC family protein [Vulcanimicrobiaceae bacterium]